MDNTQRLSAPVKRILSLLPWFLIGVGILFRLTIFFQNRNLIIDEANIVRNLDERNFIELLRPLRYEQFAPPVFLWFEELFSLLFGYGEYAARLFPLLCGIIFLFVLYALLRRVLPLQVLWFPMALAAVAPILVRYSAEVKQYVPDSLVAISLVLLALRTDMLQTAARRFTLTWILAGSIAIWTSQPSVFILACVGCYYFAICVQSKQWKYLKPLSLLAGVWLAQFGLYFMVILREQINSAYLQNYHHDYFLNLFPKDKEEWRHNWIRIKELLSNTGGWGTYARYINGVLFLVGGASLLFRHFNRFLLLGMPVVLTLLAAALHQFSLIDRVALFLLPFTMIILGFGLAELMRVPLKALRPVFAALGVFVLYHYNFSSLFRERFEFHELTKGFDYIIRKGGTGQELYVDCASGPTYDYYTRLHPGRAKWAVLKGAHVFDWADDNYPEVAARINTPRAYFIFTGGGEDLRNRHMSEVRQYMPQTDFFQHATCFVFTFSRQK